MGTERIEGGTELVVYRCEDSLESIFTAIYLSYEENRDARDTCLVLHEEPLLFAENRKVEADPGRVIKVIRTLKRRFGEDDYLSVCTALASTDENKAQAVYRTVVKGLDERCARGHLFDSLADEYVLKVFSLARAAGREIQHLKGFVRFLELENGILYAQIGPKSNAVTFLMPHFADRLSAENFVIYDENRGIFGVHPSGGRWYLLSGEESEKRELSFSEQELKYRELFCHFCHTIAIQERQNLKLQRNLLPLRYQEYMVEFGCREQL